MDEFQPSDGSLATPTTPVERGCSLSPKRILVLLQSHDETKATDAQASRLLHVHLTVAKLREEVVSKSSVSNYNG